MYNTTAEFRTEIKKPSRSFECRVTIGDLIFNNEHIVDIKLDGNIQPCDGFSIGSTTSQVLDLTLLNSLEHIYSTNQIKVEIGLNLGSKVEYILMGYYNIDDIEKTDYTTKFTAYDNMIKFETPYFSKLGNTATLQQIVNELAIITGVEFTGSLPAYNLKKLEGFTCREILSYVASICSGNALITREGKFTIVAPKEIEYSLAPDNYFDYKREEAPYKVGKVSCQVGENIISKGSLGADSMELEFENPWVNESILTDIYNKLKSFSYLGYTMKWQGDISLDVGDIITVTDTKGAVRKLPILSQSFTYTGGLTSEISAQGESKNKNSFSSNGNMNNKVDRVVTELLIVNEALINKANIQDLKATNAEIQNLKVANAEIENALIKCATIEQLSATNANIQNLIAEDARINQAIINKADITQLNAIDGKITNLQSEVGKIGVLQSDVATIKDLVAGNISSDNIQTGGITSDKLTIENGFITNAMISNLDVGKVNAGDISTNKFKIKSDDGGIEIVGATQQFKDKNNRVRIQMGKDTQGNFNFIIRGEDGTTALIDHTGIKKAAIADDLIVKDMIAPDAVGEKAIDYNSFATGFNKDTNTSTIKGTKVRLDNQNQTLEVAFTNLKSQADGTKSVTESNTTQISVQQGKINTLIADTSIVKDGQTIKLKDDYNSTVATVNSIKNTISSHTTKIDANIGKITGVESKTNVLERDLNSMSSKLSSTESIVTNHTSQINTAQITANTANTNATNAQSTANNAVNKADKAQSDANSVNNKVDSLEIGGRNLLLNSKAFKFTGSDYGNPDISKIGIIDIPNPASGFNCWCFMESLVSRRLDKNKAYCISMDIKTNASGKNIFISYDYRGSDNPRYTEKVNIVDLGTDWKRYTIKMVPKENANTSSMLLAFGSDRKMVEATQIEYKNIKIEEGTNNSDFTDAPEDTQQQIDKNKNDIVTVNTEVTTTKNKVSGIEQKLDSITTRVGSVETTTTSHTATISNHTSSLNAVDGKISTAKTQAINTASNDAKSKADKALADAKSFINVEVNKVITSTNSKFAEIKTTTDSINLEVNNTKKEVDKVNVKVDGIEVGGRNLIKESNFLVVADKNNYAKILPVRFVDNFDFNTLINKKITLSYFLNNPGSWVNGPDSYGARFGIHGSVVWIDKSGKLSSKVEYPFADYLDAKGVINKRISMTKTFTPPTGYDSIQSISFSFQPYSKPDSLNNEIWKIGLPKLEIGTKNSDWSPAPEDTSKEIIDVTTTKINEAKADIKITTDSIKQSVSNVDSKTTTINNTLNNTNTEVNTLKSKTTTLETNLTGITGRVTNVESSTATINGEVTSIKSRVQTAEQKLTATSIINTVSEALTGGKAITGTSTKLTKDSFTVENTSGSKVEITQGNVTTYYRPNKRFFSASGSSMKLYNWDNDTELLDIFKSDDGISRGVSFMMPAGGAYLSFGQIADNGSNNPLFRINKEGWAHFWTGVNFHGQETVIESVNQGNQKMWLGRNGAGIFLSTNEINTTAASGNLYLNYGRGSGVTAKQTTVRIGDGGLPISGGNGHGQIVCGSLYVHGSHNTLYNTKETGFVASEAYNMTESYEGDIGSGRTDSNGKCYIHLDSMYKKIVNTNIDYKVFITIKDDNLEENEFVRYKVNTSNPDFFVVITDVPNIHFDYEVKALVRDKETDRLIQVNEDVNISRVEDDELRNIGSISIEEQLNNIEQTMLENTSSNLSQEKLNDLNSNFSNNIGLSLLEVNNKILEEINND